MAFDLLFRVRVSRYYGDHGVWHTVFCSGLESVGTMVTMEYGTQSSQWYYGDHGVWHTVFCSVGTMVTMEYGTQSSVQG